MPKSKSAYSEPGKLGKSEHHIIVVWVDNEAGVLARAVSYTHLTLPTICSV